jgi:hypothetical protein
VRERHSDVILNYTLTIVALLFAGVLVRREMTPVAPRRAVDLGPPVYVMDWQDLIPQRLASTSAAPIRLVEFVDYECGFCNLYEETTDRISRENPGQFSITFVHFPLPGHRFARLAASAAECANQSGHFPRMHRYLFEKQDSLGLKSWIQLAHEIGVADTVAFRACLGADQTAKTIESDVQLGRAIGVNATPTVLVNGWKMPSAPTAEELGAIAEIVSRGVLWTPEGGDTIYPQRASKRTLPTGRR